MKTIAFLIGFVCGALLVDDNSPIQEHIQSGIDWGIEVFEQEARPALERIE